MWLCIYSGRQFEDKFEKSLLRKGIQMQHMRLCINSSRKHLKTPSGDKSFKCIQCNSESRQVGYLRTHLKTHSGKSVQLQPIRLCICSGWRFEKTSENPLRWKMVRMYPMWLCICTGRQFKDFCESSLWRKGVQIQPMRLCICLGSNVRKHLKTHSGEKVYKCNQCDFASVPADNLRRQVKKSAKMQQIWKDNKWKGKLGMG